MQPSWWVCHNWESQNQLSAIRWWIGSPSFQRIWPPARIKQLCRCKWDTDIKTSTAKTEVIHLSRSPYRCVLQVNGATLKQVKKFKYLVGTFTSGGRQDEELDGAKLWDLKIVSSSRYFSQLKDCSLDGLALWRLNLKLLPSQPSRKSVQWRRRRSA